MYIVTDPSYHERLMAKYEPIHAALQGRKRAWLDTAFHMGFKEWLKNEYKCENFGTTELYFASEKDFIWFKLRV